MLKILCVGINHRTASMDILERYFLNPAKESELYNLISNSSVNSELVSVQTCNRMELYLACEHDEILLSIIMKFFRLEQDEFENTFYIWQDKECVRHLFEVVSSLDSVVVGEGQILGQIRESYMRALNNGQTDKILNRLFEHAIRTGKKIRSQTDISRGAVSISNAAVELGRKVFRGLEGAKVLMLGAGHMGRLAIEHLISTKVDAVKILNRNTDRAMSDYIRAKTSVESDPKVKFLPLVLDCQRIRLLHNLLMLISILSV